jgi:hypothetical protein
MNGFINQPKSTSDILGADISLYYEAEFCIYSLEISLDSTFLEQIEKSDFDLFNSLFNYQRTWFWY